MCDSLGVPQVSLLGVLWRGTGRFIPLGLSPPWCGPPGKRIDGYPQGPNLNHS